MRPSRKSREHIVQALGSVFRRDGYAGASLVDLAAAAGLQKASLYQKFPRGKTQMAAEVLAAAHQEFGEQIVAALGQAGSPSERFAQMILQVSGFYDSGRVSCLTDTLSLGQGAARYREQQRAALTGWCRALEKLAAEAGETPETAKNWAEQVVLEIQGALVVGRATGDDHLFGRTLARLIETVPWK